MAYLFHALWYTLLLFCFSFISPRLVYISGELHFVSLCGLLQIWDGTQFKRVRNLSGHQTRTGVLAWSICILSSGSRDRNILQHDLRVSKDYINKLVGHKSEASKRIKYFRCLLVKYLAIAFSIMLLSLNYIVFPWTTCLLNLTIDYIVMNYIIY